MAFLISRKNFKLVNSMEAKFIRYFDSEQKYECPECGRVIRIFGWKREYPIGAFDSEEIDVELVEEEWDRKADWRNSVGLF